MKKCKFALILMLVLCAFAAATVQAADTSNITVTVSLAGSIEVSVNPTTWNIGSIAVNSDSAPSSFTATVGNVATKLEITGTDGAGGWTLGTRGAVDVFEVDVTNPALVLSKSYQTLAASVAAYGTKDFSLTYKSPASDDKGAGISQGFTITVKASAP